MEFTGYYELFWEMVTGMLGKFIPDEITVMTMGAQVANTGADFFQHLQLYTPFFHRFLRGILAGSEGIWVDGPEAGLAC